MDFILAGVTHLEIFVFPNSDVGINSASYICTCATFLELQSRYKVEV